MLFGKHINKYYLKYIWAYLIGIACLIIVDYVQLLLPELIGGLFKDFEDTKKIVEIGDVKKVVITVLIYTLIMAIGRIIWRLAIIGTSRKIETDLKNEMYIQTQKLSQEYHNNQKVGALMSLFTADIDSVRMSLGFGVVMFIDATFLAILAVYKMFRINVVLSIFTLIPMLTIAIGGFWLSNSFMNNHLKRQEAQEGLSDFSQENFSGISVIKAFVKERREIKEFTRHNSNVYNTSMTFIRKIALLETLIESLIGLSVVLIFGIGSLLAKSGAMDASSLATFYMYFVLIIWPMIALAQIINNLSQGRASLNRISNLLNEEVTVKDNGNLLDVSSFTGALRFNHLTFRYPNQDYNVLEDVSFQIKAGEMVGVIGRTGCGKSSLVELLLRTYNINENQIYFDNYDIMNLPIKNVRQSIGYVPQNNFLFSDTIHNNIAFGLLDDLDNRKLVRDMAGLSDIDKNISEFKDGYDTIVGERGTTLSGGQKQRISIARALIKDPTILIFDDSVSAVDTITEMQILKNLRKTRKNKTTIIIGHRISTMQNMDKIILLDEGHVIAVGTHKELSSSCQLYQDMIKAQELEEYHGN